jgi:hypothetical protein
MWRPSLAALLGALALAACGSSQSTTSSTSAPAKHGTPAKTAGPIPRCSHLAVTYVNTNGATGHLEVTFAMRNTSRRTCRIEGYPAAQLLDGAGRALPMRLQRGHGFFPDTTRPPRVVMLKPGARARFGLSFVTNNEYAGAHVCRTAAAARSSAPGAAGHWRLSLRGAPRISPCGSQLVVSPVY